LFATVFFCAQTVVSSWEDSAISLSVTLLAQPITQLCCLVVGIIHTLHTLHVLFFSAPLLTSPSARGRICNTSAIPSMRIMLVSVESEPFAIIIIPVWLVLGRYKWFSNTAPPAEHILVGAIFQHLS
jgi:hypothetical protein